MTEPQEKDEAKLEQLAKSLFKLKPKPRQDLVGKGKKKRQGTQKPSPTSPSNQKSQREDGSQ